MQVIDLVIFFCGVVLIIFVGIFVTSLKKRGLTQMNSSELPHIQTLKIERNSDWITAAVEESERQSLINKKNEIL